MASVRTQIYLSAEQRRRLDQERRRRGTTLATLVREALDAYLAAVGPDAQTALDATFAAAPDFETPSRERWNRG